MNDWVYAGFEGDLGSDMGVGFDKIYYESNTYLEGKDKVMEGILKRASSIAKKTIRYGPTLLQKDWITSCRSV